MFEQQRPQPEYINPNPHVFSEDISGSEVSELFARLLTRKIESVTIDGVTIVGVGDAHHQDSEGTMQVTAFTEDGKRHLFVYGPSTQDTVAHYLLATE